MIDVDTILAQNEEKLESLPEEPQVLAARKEFIDVAPSTAHAHYKIRPKPADFTGKKTNTRGSVYDPFYEAKREFLVTPNSTLEEVARKHGVDIVLIAEIAKRENWVSQQTNYLDQKFDKMLAEKKQQTEQENEKIGTFMIQMALRSLKKQRRLVLSFKEAKEYLVEGVRIRNQAVGLEKGQSKVVNIINQQQAVIERYRKK